jgi:hypothetical protein
MFWNRFFNYLDYFVLSITAPYALDDDEYYYEPNDTCPL